MERSCFLYPPVCVEWELWRSPADSSSTRRGRIRVYHLCH